MMCFLVLSPLFLHVSFHLSRSFGLIFPLPLTPLNTPLNVFPLPFFFPHKLPLFYFGIISFCLFEPLHSSKVFSFASPNALRCSFPLPAALPFFPLIRMEFLFFANISVTPPNNFTLLLFLCSFRRHWPLLLLIIYLFIFSPHLHNLF